ncbi:30S ribosomal protein S11 [candidate division TM6 bacterium RIFCSPHIGHO2_12_FULL_32_22]|nr:MAG: 30S ribosomal protein S11 [candidate division TM6 bacterium RIFCSPHIGHO2_12_FULL_32_22]
MAYKKKSKKIKKHVSSVIANVKSTFNNTLVSITTESGDVLLRGSAGKFGFKGSRKGTPFAASQIGSNLAKDMSALGIKNVEVNLQGPGSGRESVVRALQAAGLNITVLRDVTPLPHNGCRAPKKRRV